MALSASEICAAELYQTDTSVMEPMTSEIKIKYETIRAFVMGRAVSKERWERQFALESMRGEGLWEAQRITKDHKVGI